MIVRRLVTAASVVGMGVLLGATSAWAEEPLTPYLERAAAAEYTAQQIVSCSTPDGPRDSVVQIAHANGVLVAGPSVGEGTSIEMGGGAVASSDAGGVALGLGASAASRLRYEIGSSTVGVMAGRDVEVVSVVDEEGVQRAEMSFDMATGALLRTLVYNADGSVWCEMSLVEFEPGESGVEGMSERPSDLEVVPAPDDPRLPATAAGVERLDVYVWSDNGVVGYYSDGLFSFTILASPRPVSLTGPGVAEVDVGAGSYARWFGPGTAAYSWYSADGGVAVFGDLPLDLQARVLSDLPQPQAEGMFSRLWRRLFD